jgi:transcriptional regulator with XRE-family HTH domain
MENNIGKRIRTLRAHYNMGMKDFAQCSGLSHVAIFHLENGRTLKPHKSSMVRIASAFGTTLEWILYGKDEMLPNGTMDMSAARDGSEWKEEALSELRKKNQLLEKEVNRLWEIISHLTGGQRGLGRMMEAS